MAKSKSNNISVLAGMKVGNVRYYSRNGKTFSRSATTSHMTNNRTIEQTVNRLRFNSVRCLWTPLKEVLAATFEYQETGHSGYTAFMRLNHGNGVFLTKREQQDRVQIITPVHISEGTLTPIMQLMNGDRQVVTDIALGQLAITPQTTIADFSKAVTTHNLIDFDDEIVFVAVEQLFGDTPRCTASACSIKLDRADSRPMQMVCGTAAFAVKDGYLSSEAGLADGCYAFYRASICNGVRQVSSQTLLNNNGDAIGQYLSREKFDEARASYGEFSDDFLSPSQFKTPTFS